MAGNTASGLRAVAPTLCLIVLVAAGLRLISLGEVPPGFYVDEAAVGANARLLARGGIDQYGERFPVFFRALDDYKCGLFLYSMAPLLAWVEPTELTVRLPAALWGLLGILVAFLLARELYGSATCGLWAALFLALTPWHIHFSRIAWQAFTLTIVYPFAVLFLLRWLRRRLGRDAFLAGLLCAATLYTYTVAKLLIALTVVGVLFGLLSVRARFRDRDVWIFAGALLLAAAPFAVAYFSNYDAINHRLNLLLLPAREVPAAYLSHFLPEFFWISGDSNLRHSPGQGLLPWYLAPLLLIGLFDILRTRGRSRIGLLGIFLTVPLLGSLSQGYPHATRTIGFLPFVQIIAAGGLMTLRRFVESRGGRRLWALARAGLALIMLATLVLFVRNYWGEYRERSRDAWFDGLLPALRAAAAERRPGETVLTRPNYAHYAYWMLVTDPPPELILENRESARAGAERYDPLDLDNGYRFLGFLSVPRERGDLTSMAGLWVFPKKVVNPGLLGEMTRRGTVEVIHDGERYLVLRSHPGRAGPSR